MDLFENRTISSFLAPSGVSYLRMGILLVQIAHAEGLLGESPQAADPGQEFARLSSLDRC